MSKAPAPRVAAPVLAASVAVFRGGRVLLATRTKPPSQGVWSLPGGRVEPGETLGEAALRELMEEVGVEAGLIGFNQHVELIERDEAGGVARHIVIASFAARWRAGEPRPGPEAGAVTWADPHDLSGLEVTASLHDVVAGAARMAREG